MKKIFASIVAMMFALVVAGSVFAAPAADMGAAAGDNVAKAEKKEKKAKKRVKKVKKAKKAVDKKAADEKAVDAPVVK